MSAAALFEAIRANNVAAVQSLLTSDCSLASAQNDSGVSAVLMSIYMGRREICDVLRSHGAVLSVYDAVAVGDVFATKRFVEADPALANSFSPDGFPLVALAAVFGHLDIARYLASHGADLNALATNGSGYNALTGAVASGHTDIVKWLLENSANANYRYGAGYSPLLTAAANGHLEILKLLLSHGADPHATTNDGKCAIALATERNHSAVANHLANLGK
jgi:ankyrin repeat protein